jgi:hypothetical protein
MKFIDVVRAETNDKAGDIADLTKPIMERNGFDLGEKGMVFVQFNAMKDTFEFAIYFGFQHTNLVLINEWNEIDPWCNMRLDWSLPAERGGEDFEAIIEEMTLSLSADIADLALTIAPNSTDPLLHFVGGGRLLPRDFVRKQLKVCKEAYPVMLKKVSSESSFRKEDWWPEDHGYDSSIKLPVNDNEEV